MKIAYCVLCHKYSKVLKQMIDILGEDNDIYIHVDKKSNINQFNSIRNKAYIIDKREDVRWGHYSLVQAELNLLEEVKDKKYDYVFLISGDCLPLRNSDYIKKFLENNYGKEFVGIDNGNKNLAIERVKYNYPKIYFKKNNNVLEKIIIRIQRKLKLYSKNKLFYKLPKLYKGCNWITITGECCRYIFKYLQENPWYSKALKKSLIPDETFFQTIIMNSKYKENIYNLVEENDNLMCLRYIDWESGPEYPKILGVNDFGKISQTDCLIGRKFNDSMDFEAYVNFINRQF